MLDLVVQPTHAFSGGSTRKTVATGVAGVIAVVLTLPPAVADPDQQVRTESAAARSHHHRAAAAKWLARSRITHVASETQGGQACTGGSFPTAALASPSRSAYPSSRNAVSPAGVTCHVDCRMWLW
jgi:hypothetical protein